MTKNVARKRSRLTMGCALALRYELELFSTRVVLWGARMTKIDVESRGITLSTSLELGIGE